MVSVRPCGVSREARTLIYNGTRGFLFKTAKLIHEAHFSLRGNSECSSQQCAKIYTELTLFC